MPSAASILFLARRDWLVPEATLCNVRTLKPVRFAKSEKAIPCRSSILKTLVMVRGLTVSRFRVSCCPSKPIFAICFQQFLMPRINPVHSKDKAIGERLRELRVAHMAKRTSLALKIGISTDQLASYEFGRVPLPWGIGVKICELLNTSQSWLATGEGDWDHFYPFPISDKDGDPISGRFSEVFENHFKPGLHAWQTKAYDEAFGPNGYMSGLGKSINALEKSKQKLTAAQFAKLEKHFTTVLEGLTAARKEMDRRVNL